MEGQFQNGATIALTHAYFQDIHSSTSSPFVSAPSSPGRGSPLTAPPPAAAAFFYSAPASPMHSDAYHSSSYEFEFSARFGISGTPSGGSMTSADELFLNGQIRPMKLSSHLQRPQALDPLLDLDAHGVNEIEEEDTQVIARGRDVKWRDRSLRRRTRSMSPLRTPAFLWPEITEAGVVVDSEALESGSSKHDVGEEVFGETNPSMSASSSRSSSSASRSSKRWIFLKDFLYRSKSEGRNNGHKFWSSISFSPVKDRKASESTTDSQGKKELKQQQQQRKGGIPAASRKATNGVGGKRRIQLSPHGVHYKASRAQAEELRKKTFLPYRQGLLGCLGFSSKGYGAINGFARALNPVSSR